MNNNKIKNNFEITTLKQWKKIHFDLLESFLDKEISKQEYFELDNYMRDLDFNKFPDI